MRKIVVVVALLIVGALTVGETASVPVTSESWAQRFGVERRSAITREDLPFIDFVPRGSIVADGMRDYGLPITTVEDLKRVRGVGPAWLSFLLALYDLSAPVGSTAAATTAAGLPDFVFSEPARVTEIVDGDTFVVAWPGRSYTLRIRPASIDTPDVGECYYEEASRYAEAVLSDRLVWLDRGDPDSLWIHERLIVKIWLDSARTASFEQIMVSQGFAEVLTQYPRGRELQALGLEHEARAAKRGLWGDCR